MLPPFHSNTAQSPKKIQDYKIHIKQTLLNRFLPHWDVPDLIKQDASTREKTSVFRHWSRIRLNEQNYINAYFPIWVLIGIHCENRQTAEFTGTKDGYTSVFLAQHLSLSLLYQVTSKVIIIKKPLAILDILKSAGVDLFYHKQDTDSLLTDHDKASLLAFIFNGKLSINSCDEYTQSMIWHWCCTILSHFQPTPIMQLLDSIIKGEFTSTKAVAQHFAFGKYIKDTPTYVDRYENELDDTYLESYPHKNTNLLNRVGRYTQENSRLMSLKSEDRLNKSNRAFASIFKGQLSAYRTAIKDNPFNHLGGKKP